MDWWCGRPFRCLRASGFCGTLDVSYLLAKGHLFAFRNIGHYGHGGLHLWGQVIPDERHLAALLRAAPRSTSAASRLPAGLLKHARSKFRDPKG